MDVSHIGPADDAHHRRNPPTPNGCRRSGHAVTRRLAFALEEFHGCVERPGGCFAHIELSELGITRFDTEGAVIADGIECRMNPLTSTSPRQAVAQVAGVHKKLSCTRGPSFSCTAATVVTSRLVTASAVDPVL